VPTDKGYRYFVNALLRFQPPGQSEIDELRRHLDSHAGDSKALVTAASQMVSSLTHLAGVVTVPRETHAALSQIEFVGLSGNRVLAILVVNGREVQNRVVQLDRHFPADELRRAAAFLNEQFSGQELTGVRTRLVAQLQETREQMNRLMIDAITLAQRAFAEQPDERDADMVVAGETNLMGFAELSNVDRLRRLFEAFNEKRDILHLLDQSLHAEGVQIFIGHESGFRILDDCSVVVAPYTQDDRVVGVLGVIGPTRMAYERVIPVVDIAARILGSALNSRD
jgi:heat-inducible transcriptional repressor